MNYLKILIVSIIINYLFGLIIDKYKKYKKIFLLLGILLNLGILFYYKYYNFFVDNMNIILNTDISVKNIVLPIGISFFTFQGMSYIVDVYRGDGRVNKNIFSIALYISLFPQLVAGPIIKYKSIDNQIRDRNESIDFFSYGIDRFVIGLAKKVIIADMLGAVSDNIFMLANTSGIDVITSWIGIICYTVQIYFDFSGYSDMAIGLGYFFGFEFSENFNYPYISKSVTEFWRRWHISLSTWFREYIYIPLGGNRSGNVYFNLFIVFLVTGIWHGASWNFILWGLWHGLFIIIERIIRNKDIYLNTPTLVKRIITLFIVMLGWVMFKVSNIDEGLNYLSIMFGLKDYNNLSFTYEYFITKKIIFLIIIGIIASTPSINIIKNKFKDNKSMLELIKTIIIICLFIISILFIVNSTYSPFIYFQF